MADYKDQRKVLFNVFHSLHSIAMSPAALLPPLMSFSSSLKNGIAQPTRQSFNNTAFAFDSMEDALAAFTAGEFLVVMDDENRENEGDLIISASHCTTEKMAWMIKHTRCVHVTLLSCLPM
jgi:3,4-dihydroxy-2-butanone 4-phosphate synthase